MHDLAKEALEKGLEKLPTTTVECEKSDTGAYPSSEGDDKFFADIPVVLSEDDLRDLHMAEQTTSLRAIRKMCIFFTIVIILGLVVGTIWGIAIW